MSKQNISYLTPPIFFMENPFQVGKEYNLNLYRRDKIVTVIAVLSENTVVCLFDDEEYKTITVDIRYLENLPLQSDPDPNHDPFEDLGIGL